MMGSFTESAGSATPRVGQGWGWAAKGWGWRPRVLRARPPESQVGLHRTEGAGPSGGSQWAGLPLSLLPPWLWPSARGGHGRGRLCPPLHRPVVPLVFVPAGGSGRVLGTAGRDAPLILARSGQGATAERSRARCFSGLPGVAAGGPWCPRLSWMPAGLPFHTQLPAVLSHSSCCVRPPSAAPALAGPPEHGLCHPPAPAAGFPARGARACLPADPRAQTPRSSLLVWRPRVPGAA